MVAQKGTPNGKDHGLKIEPNPPISGQTLNVTFNGPSGSKGIEIFINGELVASGTSDTREVAVGYALLESVHEGATLVIEYFNQDQNYEPVTYQLR
ncbi:MAG: hypothetical protein RL885_15505 [Planctomycetota bacterium]